MSSRSRYPLTDRGTLGLVALITYAMAFGLARLVLP